MASINAATSHADEVTRRTSLRIFSTRSPEKQQATSADQLLKYARAVLFLDLVESVHLMQEHKAITISRWVTSSTGEEPWRRSGDGIPEDRHSHIRAGGNAAIAFAYWLQPHGDIRELEGALLDGSELRIENERGFRGLGHSP